MNPWDEQLNVFSKDIWARGFFLALTAEYLKDGGNAVKLIQNKAAIANLIAAQGKGRIDTDFEGLHENIAHKWLDAQGNVYDWKNYFREILFETWRG